MGFYDETAPTLQVTLKLISVVPAALLIFAAVKVSTPFVHAVSSRRWEPTAMVHRSMRASLREMERLLTSSRQVWCQHQAPHRFCVLWDVS